jgi:protein-export membrane protein SecD
MLIVFAVCGGFLLAALPNALSDNARKMLPSFLPTSTVPLGLDLRGGAHLLLEVDIDTYLKERYADLASSTRTALRKAQIGYTGGIRKSAKGLSIQLRSETLRDDVNLSDLFYKLDADITLSREGEHLRAYYSPQALRAIRLQLLAQSVEIVSRRVNETGTKEPIITRQGAKRIVVQVPGLQNPEQLKKLLGKTARMTFHLVNEQITPEQIASRIVPPSTRIVKNIQETGGYAREYAIYADVALSGELLTDANATFDSGQPVVSFAFNAQGARIFGEITANHVGERFAVLLDDKVITAPVMRVPILDGRGIIEGNFTVESANETAMLLRAGALPAPLDIIEERSVGPSLGQDSINAGTKAAIIGTAFVIGFMVLAYGLFGVFACFALLMNMAMILGALSIVQATLTLPGIAGLVLTMGMAVDANVLIFERIRDEINAGKSPMGAIDAGFKTAFGTIIDANITTLIAALLLFSFGSGAVKGFAVTLSIGILCSMFTAIMLTRLMVVSWFKAVRPNRVPL